MAHKLFATDLLADLPGARALLAKLGAEAHVQRIAADKAREMPGFLEAVKARARG